MTMNVVRPARTSVPTSVPRARSWNQPSRAPMSRAAFYRGRPGSGRRSALLSGRRIDRAQDLADPVGGEAALGRVLAHHLLVGRHVHAVDLVSGDVAVDPLDLRAQALQHAARLLGDTAQLLLRQLAGAGDLALDQVLGHGGLLSCFACSRSTNFWILPVDVFGSGPKTTWRGTL